MPQSSENSGWPQFAFGVFHDCRRCPPFRRQAEIQEVLAVYNPEFYQIPAVILQGIANIIQPDGMGQLPEKQSKYMTRRAETPRLLVYPELLASFGIKFRGINLKICPDTVILCFDGFMMPSMYRFVKSHFVNFHVFLRKSTFSE